MKTFRFQPRSRDAGARSSLARSIGVQFAAMLMAVLVASPADATRDAVSTTTPPLGRDTAPPHSRA